MSGLFECVFGVCNELGWSLEKTASFQHQEGPVPTRRPPRSGPVLSDGCPINGRLMTSYGTTPSHEFWFQFIEEQYESGKNVEAFL